MFLIRYKHGWLALAAAASLVACGVADEAELESWDVVEEALTAVPGRIQAESYDSAQNESTPTNLGGQCDKADGVDMEITTDAGAGCNVGWTAANERLNYVVSTAAAGAFNVTLRVASGSSTARTLHLEVNGVSVGTLTPARNGWQAWQDLTLSNVNLPAGNSTLTVVFDNGEINLNYLDVASANNAACVSRALTRQAAVASSVEAATLDASKAIDAASLNTRWASAWSDPQWIYVDLGTSQRVMGAVLSWEAAASANYDIQVSNDLSNWGPVLYNDPNGNAGVDTISGLTAVGRYVRMYSRARTLVSGARYGNSLFDFQVNGDPNPSCTIGGSSCTDGLKNGSETAVDCGGPTCGKCGNGQTCGAASDCTSGLCSGGVCQAQPSCTDGIQNGTETGVDCGGSCAPCPSGCSKTQELPRTSATASTTEAGNVAGNAIDGNASTRWSSLFADPQWIAIDLGATRKISRVLLTWEAAYSRNYDIEVRNSPNESWSPIYSTTTGDGGTDDITGLFATARYVRMNSQGRGTAWGNSLFEFRVFGDSNGGCSAACVNPDATNSTSLTLNIPGVGAKQILSGIGLGARLVRDPVSRNLFLLDVLGNIYQVNLAAATKTLVATGAQIVAGMSPAISPSTYQGLAFAPNGAMYVVLNVGIDGKWNQAYVRRGIGTGSRTWSTFASTALIPESNTPFDHHFSGIVVSPDGNYVHLTSGSRTDHGEVQANGTNFPTTREVALTAGMFRLPTSGSNLFLANDTATLQANGYLYASGLRNSYDPQFGPGGELFAGDNGPDADYSEELNALRAGQHYGFPWRLGSEDNATQFPSYNPATDKRVDPSFTAQYTNDPTFPGKPANVSLLDPFINRGPDADQFRDLVTGGISDSTSLGRSLSTFTAHRVPLGLSFDLAGSLCGADFQSKAFILSWGNAHPTSPNGFTDQGQDVLLLNIKPVGGGYEVESRKLVSGLSRPIDSVVVGNKLYVLEYADGPTGRLFEFSLPRPN